MHIGDPKELTINSSTSWVVRSRSYRGACLSGEVLTGLRCEDVDLASADLTNSNLTDVHLHNCRLRSIDLSGAIADGAVIRMCNIDAVVAVGAKLRGSRVEDSSLKGGDLTRADFESAHLSESSFDRACLYESSFRNAQGFGTRFRGADLRGSQFQNADLQEADFRGADLTDANLAGGDFRYADFRGATLDSVRWDDANLDSALFDADAEPFSKPEDPAVAGPIGGDASAVSEAVSQVVRQAIGGASKGEIKLDESFSKLTQAFQLWQSSGDSTDEDRFRELVSVMQGRLGQSNPEFGDALQPLSQIFELLQKTQPGDEEPNEAWQAVITELLGADADNDDAIEDLASRLQQILKS